VKYLIAGLGNIGNEYANTRHNVGFLVLDALIKHTNASFATGRLASVATLVLKGRSLLLVKPSTYMNLSGKAIRYWLDKEAIAPENLLVILDDIALPPGQLRLKMKGSDGNHNGLTSIIEVLQTNEFPRLRIGIGNDFPRGMQSDYVLGQWTKAEEEIMIPAIYRATDAIKSFVLLGSAQTMTKFNG